MSLRKIVQLAWNKLNKPLLSNPNANWFATHSIKEVDHYLKLLSQLEEKPEEWRESLRESQDQYFDDEKDEIRQLLLEQIGRYINNYLPNHCKYAKESSSRDLATILEAKTRQLEKAYNQAC